MKKYKYFISLFIVSLSIFFLENCSVHNKPVNKTPENSISIPSEKTVTKQNDSKNQSSPSAELQEKTSPKESSEEDIGIQEIEDNQDASKLLEEAMDAYQDARVAWDRGDLDTAIAALDEAYTFILELRLPPDSPLIQEKNDLRLLIAQRLQEIYASRYNIAFGENHKSIPLTENKYVLNEIKIFQIKERNYFEESYRRSGMYRRKILSELKKQGLPEELSWIPIIESGFKVNAYSRARALGLWQFISSTGYRFGLKRDRWIDERMDPVKSTEAALKYLNELHSLFGDWTTVLAAYNCGEFRVQRVIRAQRINYLDNFWDLYAMLPRETSRFVPRFIAALLIINSPEKYGFTLPTPYPEIKYDTISINRPIKLSSLSKALGLNSDELTSLNPELRHGATPEYDYLLKVPSGFGEKALSSIYSTPRWIPPEATYVIHYVRRGESVSGIASRYRASVSAIARLNRLGRKYLIRPGQRLKIPARGTIYSNTKPFKLSREGDKLIYTVKRGDSLYRIASSLNTSINKIKKENNLKSNIIHVGQRLIIQSGARKGTVLYTVKKGDTPYDIAKKFGISLKAFLNLNGLTSRSKIYPGQQLYVKQN